MRTTISSKYVTNLSKKELVQCKKLTFPHGSMKPQLEDEIDKVECGELERGREARVHLLKDEDKNILAWSLVFFKYRHSDKPCAYFFVNSSHRQKGYATRLMNNIRKDHEKVIVDGWDHVSNRFFGNFTFAEQDKWRY